MPSLPKKKCPICGTIFQPRRENHAFCSNSCRVKAHREKKEIPELDFLQSKKLVKNTPVNSPFTALPVEPLRIINQQESNPSFTEIGVKEYVPNPAYLRAAKAYQLHVDNTEALKNKRETLQSEIAKFRGKTAQKMGAIIGGLSGAALWVGKAYVSGNNSKFSTAYYWIVGFVSGFLGAVTGALLGKASYFNSDKAEKLAQAEWKEIELTELNEQILESQTQEQDLKTERDAVKREIPQYENVNPDYTDFEDVSNQKAISMEQFKTMKFKPLHFEGEWKKLMGTPESNFGMMVYGKAGQGKSYFCLELASYLGNNFGDVIYNSSEEGLSLSLQNKVQTMDMTNIHLGTAKDLIALQMLLSQSPYKFVFLDSLNDMKISSKDFKQLKSMHPDKAFIGILQSTKSGSFKGSNDYEHDMDISLKIENQVAECKKGRFQ